MIYDRVTVFVVDDDDSVRRSLDRLLRGLGYHVATFASAEAFLSEKISPQIGCLVLDLSLPGLDGLELQARLRRQGMFLPIVFMTGHGDIPKAVQAVKSGALSFLTKPCSEKELVREIDNALSYSKREFREHSEAASIQRRYATLTPREREIFSLVISGNLNKQTAAELGIVENTVKVHRRRVMKKMRSESLAELVIMGQKLNQYMAEPTFITTQTTGNRLRRESALGVG